MTDTPPRKSFSEMRRELAKQRGRPLPEEPRKLQSVPQAPTDPDLIPDVLGDQTEDDLNVDRIIDSIDILDAYRKWIGKEVDESTTNRRENIMISCPLPDHRDKKPSAWINRDKQVWNCGVCDEGGDLYDFAAIKFGYDRPAYKDGKTFHDLRAEMAESYGYRIKNVSGVEIVWKEEEEEKPAKKPAQPSIPKAKTAPAAEPEDEPEATVTFLRDEDVEDEEEEDIDYPSLDWQTLVPADTFLHEYLTACSRDDSPEEYHFWHGLLALGHAVGRNVYLDDLKPVRGHLLVCLLGGTGYGKSRSRHWLETVLKEAVPFQDNGLDTTGCKLVMTPASGENLIKQFEHIAHDPSLGKGLPAFRTPINGMVDYDEFASLLGRAMRPGSILKVIIQGFADGREDIATSSNTGGTFQAVQPFCSITASTQPRAVRTLLSKYDTASGFLNRWVFIGGQRKRRESFGGRRSKINVDLTKAIDELKSVRAWGSVEREVYLSDEAYTEWDRWFHLVLEPLQVNDKTDLLSRITLILKRVMLLFAINERKTEISADDIKRLEPILTYLIRCYAILDSQIGISEIKEISDDIMRMIKNVEAKTGRGASARDLSTRLHRKSYDPQLIKKALDILVGLDWLEIDKTKGPGRPTLRYRVVSE